MASKRGDSEVSIEKIESAALQLFAKKGYSNTSLEQVAAMAGFTKGAVYYYFKTKETLLLHLLARIQERSILATAARVREMPGGAIQKLEAFVQLQAQWAATYPNDLVILVLTSLEFHDADTPVREAIRDYYRHMEALLTEVFTAGKETGEIGQKVDVSAAVLANIARHDGNMLLWHRSGCDPSVGRVLTSAARHAVRQFGVEAGQVVA
ncbi:TetR/AcrR family transcriptional regulator [Parapusillimonas granuli]|uniref:TetR/AcrR family transcriptional regulator n=1 Tax=Parapusillimonas granuli TaxID=380911 RepID=A0A853FZ62_9BURK|nr:TetR/AcrR family transcriptional regulator [Parapusillimonas granuli]MBB5216584.1 AcrR family transcriptional regulator [Parapusillimonas granuli]MEB2399673.1 TetR/AcrR family transcriptional regulator [Alcaligenaceae bacterium]NYT48110.1 TetR/AcrR family transcriptional regulator [Parapusillimonas granuli]